MYDLIKFLINFEKPLLRMLIKPFARVISTAKKEHDNEEEYDRNPIRKSFSESDLTTPRLSFEFKNKV